jgi:hypothetical protein
VLGDDHTLVFAFDLVHDRGQLVPDVLESHLLRATHSHNYSHFLAGSTVLNFLGVPTREPDES